MRAAPGTAVVRTGVAGDDGSGVFARTLTRLATAAPDLEGVWKRDVKSGDWIVATTRNSTYTLAVQDDLTVVVTGGWFQRAEVGGRRVHVNGCTWGGSAILTGMLAAPGMCIEFGNGVRTTRVRDVEVIRDVAGRAH
jgi:hypothetical protein